MATTNTSAATATAIKGWSTTVQNFSDLGAPPYDLWFKYTPVENESAVGVRAYASGANYTVRLSILAGPITALDVVKTMGTDAEPMMAYTTPGEALYFKAEIAGSGTPNVPLSFLLVQSPTGTAPIGSLLINDLTYPYPAAIISPTGEVLGYLPAAAGESGAVLPDCTIALEDLEHNDIKIYDGQLQQIATAPVDLNLNGQISTNLKDKFFAGESSAVYRFGKTGTIEATWNIGAGGTLTGLAPSPDESILYYTREGTGTGSELPVKRWDLINNVALSDLAASIPGTRTGHDVLVMADGSILVPYKPFPPLATVRRYNAAGVVLNTITVTPHTGTGNIEHIQLDPLDSGVFLVVEQNNTTRYFTRVQATTGTVVNQFSSPVATDGTTSDGTSFFGASFSCPILILKCPITIPPTEAPRRKPTTTPTCPCPTPETTNTPGTTTITTGPPTTTGGPPSTTPPGATPVPPVPPAERPIKWTPFALCAAGGTVESYSA